MESLDKRSGGLPIFVGVLIIFCFVTVLSAFQPQEEAPAASDIGPQKAIEVFFNLVQTANPQQRGVPSGPAGKGTAVWETFKNSSEVFRPDGQKPCDWNTKCEIPSGSRPPTIADLQKAYGVADSNWIHFLSSNRMIDGQQVVNQRSRVIRYDVRSNQQFFNYVVTGAKYPLYNTQGQEAARVDSQFSFSFPNESIEVKAAWMIVNRDDDVSKYWTAYGAYYDEASILQYRRIALTAIHMIYRYQGNWIWLTYENDNASKDTFMWFLEQKGKPVGNNLTKTPGSYQATEDLKKKLVNTKWANYTIIGWQLDEVDAAGKPVRLANMNIETYFPITSSCKSCHAMANIGPDSDRRLNMWDQSSGGIVGRMGNVDFQKIAQQLSPGNDYKQTDYVWSLREAQPTSASNKKSKRLRRFPHFDEEGVVAPQETPLSPEDDESDKASSEDRRSSRTNSSGLIDPLGATAADSK